MVDGRRNRKLTNNNIIQLLGRSTDGTEPIRLGAGHTGISMTRDLMGLPNGRTDFSQSFTVHMRFAFTNGESNEFTRLIRFSDDPTDEYGLYFHHSFFPRIGLERSGFGPNRLDQYLPLRTFPLQANEYIDIVFSLSSSGFIQIWWTTDGDTNLAGANLLTQGNFADFREPRFAFHSRATFFQDNTEGTRPNENLPVHVDFVDIYAGTVTPSQLQAANFGVLRDSASTIAASTHGIGQVTTRIFFAGTNRQLVDTDIGNFFGQEIALSSTGGTTVTHGGSIDDRWFIALTDCPATLNSNAGPNDICVVVYTSTNSILACNPEPNNNFCFMAPAMVDPGLAQDPRTIFVADNTAGCANPNPNRGSCFRLRTSMGEHGGNFVGFAINDDGESLSAYPASPIPGVQTVVTQGVVFDDQLGF